MFIETLEFTIPVDLCDLFSTLKRGPRSNMEFPASVNSYGTTQDANIQVVLRSNKLTFKVDGVSSDASMISKSECKNLKLSIFDVDRSLMPQDMPQDETYEEMPVMQESQVHQPMSVPSKRARDFSTPVRSPPVKTSRISYSESSRGNTPNRHQNQNNSHSNNQSQSRPSNDNSLNVKQEPEDPDLIEIEPDPEPDDIVPKKESTYYSSCSVDIPHTQTSQAALDRLSHPQSSHSQSPASSSSSFHQNVPHVQDYSEPGPSQSHHGDQSADDFLVFQEHDDNEDCDNDNEAEFDNDGFGMSMGFNQFMPSRSAIGSDPWADTTNEGHSFSNVTNQRSYNRNVALTTINPADIPEVAEIPVSFVRVENVDKVACPLCNRSFLSIYSMRDHYRTSHDNMTYNCVCGKSYKSRNGLWLHRKICPVYKMQ